jgi:hypothetical protein
MAVSKSSSEKATVFGSTCSPAVALRSEIGANPYVRDAMPVRHELLVHGTVVATGAAIDMTQSHLRFVEARQLDTSQVGWTMSWSSLQPRRH